MTATAKISVALTDEQLGALRTAVAKGEYADASEAVREALSDWQAKRRRRRDQDEAIGRLWDEGLDSGPPERLDLDAVLAEARACLAAATRGHGGRD